MCQLRLWSCILGCLSKWMETLDGLVSNTFVGDQGVVMAKRWSRRFQPSVTYLPLAFCVYGNQPAFLQQVVHL